ncbi:beta-lactamase/transpeptidase-like protein [Thozetella sp. PMI_491]|nr:beta-lactamase/transpeptidase-like protein [Thozetella sp. PMI_491]
MSQWVSAGVNNSALSLALKSTHEDVPFYEYHYTPTALDPRGVQTIDSNSVYRLGSTTKLFPVLALLKLKSHGVSWEDPVTKYLPRLRDMNSQASPQNAIMTVDWDDITLGSLANHISGIGSDYPIDITNFQGTSFEDVGLPPMDQQPIPGCFGLLDTPSCTAEDFYSTYGLHPPVFAPFTTPSYSNTGFAILGLVVEAVTNTPFEQFIKTEILEPLGMSHTYQDAPADSLGVIPEGEIFWNATLGMEDPAGSYYSSLGDLTAFGDAILGAKVLTPVEVRKWLKPTASTPSLGTLIGMPWEIYRMENVTKDGRLLEIYTKGGDLITYHSTLVLVPDYDFVLATLAAGSTGGFLESTMAGVVKLLLPAMEQAGKDEAIVNYAGTYVDEATNSTVTFDVDEAPGLNTTNWFVRGKDIIATYVDIGLIPGPPPTAPLIRVRLYPTYIETDTQKAWRANFDVGTAEDMDAANTLFPWPEANCVTWASIDRYTYQLKSTDSFIFDVEQAEDGSKVATAVELPAYKVKLTRKS